jgi:hypothetical protein
MVDAIRRPGGGLAHQPTGEPGNGTYCLYPGPETAGLTERVPLAQVAPADRCAQCWPPLNVA